jgi:hypothetical protein
MAENSKKKMKKNKKSFCLRFGTARAAAPVPKVNYIPNTSSHSWEVIPVLMNSRSSALSRGIAFWINSPAFQVAISSAVTSRVRVRVIPEWIDVFVISIFLIIILLPDAQSVKQLNEQKAKGNCSK